MAKNTENNEIMTLAEVAKYLQLAEKTVLRMVQRGEIPAAKIASQWRFMRPVIQDWLIAQMQTIASYDIESVVSKRAPELQINGIFRPDMMVLNIIPGPKETILKQLMAPLKKTGFARNPSIFLQSLIERERMMTTAVGLGIAMPHPRKPLKDMFSEPAVVLGICPKGTNFEAVDDQLVHLFFLICATRDEIHLRLMAKVSWLAKQDDVLNKLNQISSEHEIINFIAAASAKIDSISADKKFHGANSENKQV